MMEDRSSRPELPKRRRWAKTRDAFPSTDCPIGQSTARHRMKTDPDFPKPRRIGRDLFWDLDALSEWLDQQVDRGYTPKRWLNRDDDAA